mgnify:CR=1 FL=1
MTLTETADKLAKIALAFNSLMRAAEQLDALGLDTAAIDAQIETLVALQTEIVTPLKSRHSKYLAMANASSNASLTERAGFQAEADKIRDAVGGFVTDL